MVWREEWTLDSVTGVSCDVNIKSIEEVEEELFNKWVASFIVWWKHKLDVKM